MLYYCLLVYQNRLLSQRVPLQSDPRYGHPLLLPPDRAAHSSGDRHLLVQLPSGRLSGYWHFWEVEPAEVAADFL